MTDGIVRRAVQEIFERLGGRGDCGARTMRRATRKVHLDKNHKTLCEEVSRRGVEVVEIMEPVDTVMRLGHFVGFVEIKPEGQATYRRRQLEFISATRMPVTIARTADEAITFLDSGVGLSQEQKDAITGFLLRHPDGDKWDSRQIDRLIHNDEKETQKKI